MLQDQNLNDVIDAFEAGYADAVGAIWQASPCPFGAHDLVRRTAWIDGISFNTATAANPSKYGESPFLPTSAANGYGVGLQRHPFVGKFIPTGPRAK
ncbi:hypothetical protein [Sphingomonas sp. PAMC 26617]|uniref:hypothetical protein n=1 Tax=Sphingomonas sp. PAMC 26617 TaxID=1112216 RepID=UPI00028880EE|nr:hypothetical protein [Sphingomonas sp. PAMC 26617]